MVIGNNWSTYLFRQMISVVYAYYVEYFILEICKVNTYGRKKQAIHSLAHMLK